MHGEQPRVVECHLGHHRLGARAQGTVEQEPGGVGGATRLQDAVELAQVVGRRPRGQVGEHRMREGEVERPLRVRKGEGVSRRKRVVWFVRRVVQRCVGEPKVGEAWSDVFLAPGDHLLHDVEAFVPSITVHVVTEVACRATHPTADVEHRVIGPEAGHVHPPHCGERHIVERRCRTDPGLKLLAGHRDRPFVRERSDPSPGVLQRYRRFPHRRSCGVTFPLTKEACRHALSPCRSSSRMEPTPDGRCGTKRRARLCRAAQAAGRARLMSCC